MTFNPNIEGFKPPQKEVIPIRRSARIHRALDHLCLNIEVEEHSLGDLNEPTNYKAAMLDLEYDKWLDAMNAEMQSMKDNQVWRLVDLPPNCKTIRSKWLFKKKTDMDGIVHTYKSRLVAKGYTQTYRVDYEETLSLVADIRVIRILIAITMFYDYEIWKMDVKTAFLNSYLDEDIYMVNLEAELRADCYCNAGFKTNRDDIKSQTGYVSVLNMNVIADDVLSIHVGDEELNSIDDVGTGKMTKKNDKAGDGEGCLEAESIGLTHLC
ncbi:retrotransposon protein, putative, ty1-copia subclass [Tanacetum coccineum]